MFSLVLLGCVPVNPPSPTPAEVELVVEIDEATEEFIEPTEAPTEPSLPTATMASTEEIVEDLSPTATSVIRTPIPEHTITMTPTPVSWINEGTEFPEPRINILSPGHLSRVLSPFNLSVDLEPGYLGRIRIELIGEDGRELMRMIDSPINYWGTDSFNVFREIEFEIEGLVEYARLQISVDDQYGRTTHLSSVDLFLMSDGVAEIFPGTEHSEKIIIQHPAEDIAVYGNYIIITGLAKPADEKPLVLEIMSEEGKYLATGMAPVIIPEGETWGLFAAEITLDLEEAQRVLIVVRERGSRIPGNAAISSVEVLLSP